ncbi:hypothetical protein E2562_006640 [Oryza meyeriana var. granulata]|uniref:Uncharacterized protein n=1 Tax=Oryza meyeriana var. granulata TaxID=110450 RepID=A0A6G1EFR7_9ORYZ|nr:hypothetical protein E2562_006640 [Oryza meyeriana var. granulata]
MVELTGEEREVRSWSKSRPAGEEGVGQEGERHDNMLRGGHPARRYHCRLHACPPSSSRSGTGGAT